MLLFNCPLQRLNSLGSFAGLENRNGGLVVKIKDRGLLTADIPALGLYPQLIAAGRDLQELHALMAPQPFLASGGSEDPPKRWEALNHAIEVNGVLGYEDRVAMSNRPEMESVPDAIALHSSTYQSRSLCDCRGS